MMVAARAPGVRDEGILVLWRAHFACNGYEIETAGKGNWDVAFVDMTCDRYPCPCMFNLLIDGQMLTKPDMAAMLKPHIQSNGHQLPVWAMTYIHDPNADAFHIWEFQV